MWDYIVAILAVACLLGLKVFLTHKSYENKKHLYEDPKSLAQDILGKKKKEMAVILEKIRDVNQLKLIMLRNLTVIRSECNPSL